MLLLLVEMERMLELVAEALAVWRLRVTAVLFLVNVAGTTSLCLSALLFGDMSWACVLQCETPLADCAG